MRRIALRWWSEMNVLLWGAASSAHTLLCCCSLVNRAPFCILDMAIKSLMQWRPEHQGTRYSAATCCSKSDTTTQHTKGNVCCQPTKTNVANKSLLITFKYDVSKCWVHFWLCGHFLTAVLCLFVCFLCAFPRSNVGSPSCCNPSHQIELVAHCSTEYLSCFEGTARYSTSTMST